MSQSAFQVVPEGLTFATRDGAPCFSWRELEGRNVWGAVLLLIVGTLVFLGVHTSQLVESLPDWMELVSGMMAWYVGLGALLNRTQIFAGPGTLIARERPFPLRFDVRVSGVTQLFIVEATRKNVTSYALHAALACGSAVKLARVRSYAHGWFIEETLERHAGIADTCSPARNHSDALSRR